MLSNSLVLGTQHDCRRETQSKVDKYKVGAKFSPTFIILLAFAGPSEESGLL
jgi:hypothetical protein